MLYGILGLLACCAIIHMSYKQKEMTDKMQEILEEQMKTTEILKEISNKLNK